MPVFSELIFRRPPWLVGPDLKESLAHFAHAREELRLEPVEFNL